MKSQGTRARYTEILWGPKVKARYSRWPAPRHVTGPANGSEVMLKIESSTSVSGVPVSQDGHSDLPENGIGKKLAEITKIDPSRDLPYLNLFVRRTEITIAGAKRD